MYSLDFKEYAVRTLCDNVTKQILYSFICLRESKIMSLNRSRCFICNYFRLLVSTRNSQVPFSGPHELALLKLLFICCVLQGAKLQMLDLGPIPTLCANKCSKEKRMRYVKLGLDNKNIESDDSKFECSKNKFKSVFLKSLNYQKH